MRANRFSVLFAGFIVLFGVIHPALAEEQGPPPDKYSDLVMAFNDKNRSYADLIRAQAEYIRMVGEARLQIARAKLTEAQAAKEWAEVRRLNLLVNEMYLELRRLNKEQAKVNTLVKQVESATLSLKVVFTGAMGPRVFAAFRRLFIKIIPASAIVTMMSTPVEQFRADNFVGAVELCPDFEGDTVGKLITFMEKYRCAFEPYGDAHLVMLSAINGIFTAAESELDIVRQRMEDLRKGILDVWKAPGVKPPSNPPTTSASTTEPAKPPVAVASGSNPPSMPHDFCLSAKIGYKSCYGDGGDTTSCRRADRGFADCREDGNDRSFCLSAKSGYKACREDGNLPQDCLGADSGFVECRADGNSPEFCIPAKGGYRDCRNDGGTAIQCQFADRGYKDCRADGLSPAICLPARGVFKFCREEGLNYPTCVKAGKGYQQCREAGFPASKCLTADDGFKDCFSPLEA